MPMVRAMRLLNAIEAGTTSGAQLQTLLTADPGRLAEFNVLLGMRGQARRMAASSTAMAAVIASPTAMAAVAASSTAMAAVIASPTAMAAVIASSTAMAAIYASPAGLLSVMPSAFAVYAPHTALLTLAGSEVTQWSDATGHGYHLLGATSGARPVFTGAAANGYTTLDFDGANDKLVSASVTVPDACTVFIVRQRDVTSNKPLLAHDSTDNGGVIWESGGNLYLDHSGAASTYSFAHGATSTSAYELISGWGTGNTTNMRLNAGTPVQRTDCNLLGNAAYPLSLGYGLDASVGGMYYDGKIAEVIILGAEKAPGSAEYDRIHNLLRTKYALW